MVYREVIIIKIFSGILNISGQKSLFSRCKVPLCFFIILFAACSYAAEIEDVIPAYSAAYMVINDVPGVWNAAKASPSWQFLLSSSKMINGVKPSTGITTPINTGMNWMKILLNDPQKLVDISGNRVAFVQIRKDIGAISVYAMIADLGAPKAAPELMSKVEQVLGSYENYEVKPQAGEYRGVPFGLMKHKSGEILLRYAFLDNLLVFSPDQDAYETIVDVYLGKIPSLTYDPKFNKTRAVVSSEGELFIYVNLEIQWLMNTMNTKNLTFLKMLGMCEIKSITWTVNLLAPDSAQEIYVYTGDGSGLLAATFAEPKQLISPHLIPASDADIFLAVHLSDLETVLEKVNESVRNVAYSGISRFEQSTGLSLKDDILSSLTGEFGFAMPSAGVIALMKDPGLLLEAGFMMFCGVKDRQRCAMSIERSLSAAKIQAEQLEHKGVKVYCIPALSSSEVPVGYMFSDELLVFGNLQKLNDLIEEKPPLVVSEEFAKLNARLSQQPGLLYYIDIGKIALIPAYAGIPKLDELLLRLTPEIQPGGDAARWQMSGIIGGTVSPNGEGLKVRSISTHGKSWLELTGYLATLWFHSPSQPNSDSYER